MCPRTWPFMNLGTWWYVPSSVASWYFNCITEDSLSLHTSFSQKWKGEIEFPHFLQCPRTLCGRCKCPLQMATTESNWWKRTPRPRKMSTTCPLSSDWFKNVHDFSYLFYWLKSVQIFSWLVSQFFRSLPFNFGSKN